MTLAAASALTLGPLLLTEASGLMLYDMDFHFQQFSSTSLASQFAEILILTLSMQLAGSAILYRFS